MQVTVHVNSGTFVGLTLMYGDVILATVGQTSGTGSEVTPNTSNLILWYIDTIYENDKTTGLIFYWARKLCPFWLKIL